MNNPLNTGLTARVLESHAITNLGKARKNNEDKFLLDDVFVTDDELMVAGEENVERGGAAPMQKSRHVLAVCDGMGGEDCGEVASQIAAKEFAYLFTKENFSDTIKEMESALLRANARMFAQVEEMGLRRIGAAAALAVVLDGRLYAINVGDSRIYLYRDKGLRKLSVDHTEVRYAVEAGLISVEEARTHPLRHCLTQCLGMDPKERRLAPHSVDAGALLQGDRLLLCSDGLTDMVDDQAIERLLDAGGTAQDTAERLVRAALAAGGKDNVTVVVSVVR